MPTPTHLFGPCCACVALSCGRTFQRPSPLSPGSKARLPRFGPAAEQLQPTLDCTFPSFIQRQSHPTTHCAVHPISRTSCISFWNAAKPTEDCKPAVRVGAVPSSKGAGRFAPRRERLRAASTTVEFRQDPAVCPTAQAQRVCLVAHSCANTAVLYSMEGPVPQDRS